LASALRADSPPDPEGPLVLPGLYQVILTVMGKSYTQPLTVRRDPRIGASGTAAAAATTTLQRQFDLADQAYEAMATAHAGFTQLTRVRAQLKPFIAASDIDLAQAAADLDVRLADLDGSDANGLLLPDADNGLDEGVEDKDHDLPVEAKPVPVSLTKDYDDPTMIIGRAFENANHAPAFAIVNMQLAALLTRTEAGDIAPSSAETADYQRSCETLASALATWQGIVTSDLPQFNRELTKRKLAPLLFAATVPAARVCK
jgi:hypothetical protein